MNRARSNGHAIHPPPVRWRPARLGDVTALRERSVMPQSLDPDTPCVELDHLGRGDGRLLALSSARHYAAAKTAFAAGDVLFGRLRPYLRKFWLADRDGICSTEIWPLMADPEALDSRFLLALVQTPAFAEAAGISYGTHMPRADWTVLREFAFRLPDLAEQRRIAAALGDVDGLMDALTLLLAKKREVKDAAADALLSGRRRLPGCASRWQRRALGEIGVFHQGSGIRRSELSAAGAPCVHYGELYTRYRDTIESPVSRVPQAVAAQAFPLAQGDLLFAGSGERADQIGRCAAYLGPGRGARAAYAGSDIVVLRPHRPQCHAPRFLGHLLNHPAVAAQKARRGQGDAVVHLAAAQLAQVEVELPPAPEQQEIAAVLRDMDAEMRALDARRRKTRAIKHGMLQQLLAGAVRLGIR